MSAFEDEEYGYLKWVENYPSGFVVNVVSGAAPKLHSARCGMIKTSKRGKYKMNGQSKYCFQTRKEVERASNLKYLGKLSECKVCNPLK